MKKQLGPDMLQPFRMDTGRADMVSLAKDQPQEGE